jgi:hypothetical protein
MDLTRGNLTATLASLENKGSEVRALGTEVVDGVTCTGYVVTPPGQQETTTVWIDPQHLLRQISVHATVSLQADEGSASTAPAGTESVDATMDFAYSTAPLHVSAPAASTVSSATSFTSE